MEPTPHHDDAVRPDSAGITLLKAVSPRRFPYLCVIGRPWAYMGEVKPLVQGRVVYIDSPGSMSPPAQRKAQTEIRMATGQSAGRWAALAAAVKRGRTAQC